MSDTHLFNKGAKSWKIYAKEIISKSEDNLDISSSNDIIITGSEIKTKGDLIVEGNILPKDSNDLFNKRNSDRQWYTMPNTEVMNKQTEFAKWCYKTPPTCKEGNGIQCANNLHPRLTRHSGDAVAE